mgnify:CR=1 FL=1
MIKRVEGRDQPLEGGVAGQADRVIAQCARRLVGVMGVEAAVLEDGGDDRQRQRHLQAHAQLRVEQLQQGAGEDQRRARGVHQDGGDDAEDEDEVEA